MRKVWSFGHLLISYSIMLIAILLVLGIVLFTLVFNQLSTVQQQIFRYTTIVQLASELTEARGAFHQLVAASSSEEHIDESLRTISISDERARLLLQKLHTTYETNPQQYFLLRGIENGLDFIAEQLALLMKSLPLDAGGYSRYYMIDTTFSYLDDYIYARFLPSAVLEDAEAVNQMQESIARIRTLALLLVLFLSILCTIAIMLIVRSLAHPVRAMAQTAEEIAKGNLDTPDLPAKGPAEIQMLEQSLNSMKRSLQERITALDENVKLEKLIHRQELQQMKTRRELDRARLLTLQAQINPHFLFNAMNTISRTAFFEHAEETASLISDLASVFRYILDQRTTVPLSAEIAFIGNYLRIQKVRFGERLDYNISCPDEFGEILIPPLIIQPFVENAIIHGLEPLEEGGSVSVDVISEKRRLIILIEDSGIGIEESRIPGLLETSQKSENLHVGMSNVMERIKLYYGQTASLQVMGSIPHGTVVQVSLPIRRQDRMRIYQDAHSVDSR